MSSETLHIPICIVTPQGVIAAPYTANSLADAAAHEPQGVYTVGRTYQRDHALLFDDHLDRLEQSARLEHISVQLDRKALRKALRDLIDQSGYAESRYRITIPRATPDQLIISLERFKPVPAEIITRGARVITIGLERHNPAAKTTVWMTERQAAVQTFPVGIYEGILTAADGTMLEGTSSNFYAILNGTLRTANEGVLGGIGRRVLLKVAPDILSVDLRPVRIDEPFDEAFLTSASRHVIPVVEIDGRKVGSGQPGPYTLRLRDAYDRWAAAHLELI